VTLEKGIARAFQMDDATWARHSNPWSVWTRFTAMPLIIVAVWSRAWLGWCSLIPIALSLAWTWLNPRVFAAPRSTDAWTSRGVFGERIWLARKEEPVPKRHRVLPNVLNAVGAAGIPLIAWGVYRFSLWPTLVGCALVYAGKLWYLDRMVWLFDDVSRDDPKYAAWIYTKDDSGS
jgi:hypothetical protein